MRFPRTDSSQAPAEPLPGRWFISPRTGPQFAVEAGAVIRVLQEEADFRAWNLAQLTDAPRTRYWRFADFESPSLALSEPIEAALFDLDSSATQMRPRLLALVEEQFLDSLARSQLMTVLDRQAPVPSKGPIDRVMIWRARVPGSLDTVYMVEATRCYGDGVTMGRCAEITVFDLWIVERSKTLTIVGRRGPEAADNDFKHGMSVRPFALFRHQNRTFVVLEHSSYTSVSKEVWELAATGLRKATSYDPEA